MKQLSLLAAVIVACQACSSPSGVVCTQELRAAISVTVRDSATNAPSSRDATVTVKDGAYTNAGVVPAGSASPLGLAHEREGIYTITVDQAGSRQWQRTGVVVTRNVCHVQTVEALARLQP